MLIFDYLKALLNFARVEHEQLLEERLHNLQHAIPKPRDRHCDPTRASKQTQLDPRTPGLVQQSPYPLDEQLNEQLPHTHLFRRIVSQVEQLALDDHLRQAVFVVSFGEDVKLLTLLLLGQLGQLVQGRRLLRD